MEGKLFLLDKATPPPMRVPKPRSPSTSSVSHPQAPEQKLTLMS